MRGDGSVADVATGDYAGGFSVDDDDDGVAVDVASCCPMKAERLQQQQRLRRRKKRTTRREGSGGERTRAAGASLDLRQAGEGVAEWMGEGATVAGMRMRKRMKTRMRMRTRMRKKRKRMKGRMMMAGATPGRWGAWWGQDGCVDVCSGWRCRCGQCGNADCKVSRSVGERREGGSSAEVRCV